MKYSISLILILFSNCCFAGAWGVGSFENDSALDWVYELESASSSKILKNAFYNVRGKKHLEVDSCSIALAAAEIVASLNEKKHSHLPSEVQTWITNNSIKPSKDLRDSATAALGSCTNSKISEIAQLWEESAKSEWLSYTAKLQKRLR